MPCGRASRMKEGSMLRRMNDMPSGTIGFEAVGEVDDGD